MIVVLPTSVCAVKKSYLNLVVLHRYNRYLPQKNHLVSSSSTFQRFIVSFFHFSQCKAHKLTKNQKLFGFRRYNDLFLAWHPLSIKSGALMKAIIQSVCRNFCINIPHFFCYIITNLRLIIVFFFAYLYCFLPQPSTRVLEISDSSLSETNIRKKSQFTTKNVDIYR